MFPDHSFLFILLLFSSFSASLSISVDTAALLAFKTSSDPTNSLASWLDSSDPCSGSWLGVTCNRRTHRVNVLVLNDLNLSGSTQPLSQLAHLRLLSLNHNRLSSALNFSSWPNLKHLYLSHNNFTGKFPDGISRLRRIRRLDLSYNHFSGEIPMTQLNQLPHLLTLRLEGNEFAGTLDSVVNSSSSIKDFNVSSNNLSGEIPPWMSRFPPTSFAGNENLCGENLSHRCSNQSQTHSEKPIASGEKTKKPSDRVLLTIVAVDVGAVLAIIGAVWCCCYKKSGPHRKGKEKNGTHYNGYYGQEKGMMLTRQGDGGDMVVFDGCKGFSAVDDLLRASAEMLGKGCVGTTYKVVMDGGDVVVVKRVKERTKRKEVDGWLREIGGLRHCNVVSLRAYNHSRDELLLVYDLLPSGSLHSLLHGNRGPGRTPLEWTTRLRLASGAAQGLAFLHCYSKAKLFFHGHLTSSNIIVDHLGNACVADIGLHQLLPVPPKSSSSHNAYRAPELVSNKFSQKCDVYSFGVILLEILTGKMADHGEGGLGLVKWVQKVVGQEKEWTWEVFDFELFGYKEMVEEMRAVLEVAMLCLAPLARDRPKMVMVSKMIEDIRGGKGKGGEDMASSIMDDLSSDSSQTLAENNII